MTADRLAYRHEYFLTCIYDSGHLLKIPISSYYLYEPPDATHYYAAYISAPTDAAIVVSAASA